MTNDFKDQFKMLRDELALFPHERASIREALAKRLASETPSRPVPSPFFSYFSFAQRSAFAFLALIAVALGGTAVAAEGALPGDTLYGVKVGLNERVERIASVGTLARAQVDVRHAEERIREVELLAAKDENDTREVAAIAKLIDEHIQRAGEAAEELAREGNDADADLVAARIDSALSAHADILEAQAENEEDEGRRRLRALSVALSVAAKERIPEEEKTKARTGDYYERIALAREAHVKRSVASLAKELKSDGVPEETIAALTEEHDALESALEDARMREAEGDYRDAAQMYETLAKRAYRALALVTSAKRIADHTDKEVIVDLKGESEAEADTAAPALMMTGEAATMTAAEATLLTSTASEDENARMKRQAEDDGPTLKFLIRKREK
jgi:hypothetical protein